MCDKILEESFKKRAGSHVSCYIKFKYDKDGRELTVFSALVIGDVGESRVTGVMKEAKLHWVEV